MRAGERLLEIFRQLGEAEQKSLLDMAEFLQSRAGAGLPGQAADRAVAEPLPIPRPADETVVGAMKRLTATYPMIDKSTVLHQSSALMTEHMLGGRGAAEVIDEMQALFEKEYNKLRQSTG